MQHHCFDLDFFLNHAQDWGNFTLGFKIKRIWAIITSRSMEIKLKFIFSQIGSFMEEQIICRTSFLDLLG